MRFSETSVTVTSRRSFNIPGDMNRYQQSRENSKLAQVFNSPCYSLWKA